MDQLVYIVPEEKLKAQSCKERFDINEEISLQRPARQEANAKTIGASNHVTRKTALASFKLHFFSKTIKNPLKPESHEERR